MRAAVTGAEGEQQHKEKIWMDQERSSRSDNRGTETKSRGPGTEKVDRENRSESGAFVGVSLSRRRSSISNSNRCSTGRRGAAESMQQLYATGGGALRGRGWRILFSHCPLYVS